MRGVGPGRQREQQNRILAARGKTEGADGTRGSRDSRSLISIPIIVLGHDRRLAPDDEPGVLHHAADTEPGSTAD